MLFREEQHLVIEEVPVAGALADRDDGDKDSRCGGQVGGLSVETSISVVRGGQRRYVIPVVLVSQGPEACRSHPARRSEQPVSIRTSAMLSSVSNLGQLLRLRNQFVGILGEVLLRLHQASVGHDDECRTTRV